MFREENVRERTLAVPRKGRGTSQLAAVRRLQQSPTALEIPSEEGLSPALARLPPFRRFLKYLHPEAIPGPGAAVYNAVSSIAIFQRAYKLVARHIVEHCSQGSLLDIGTGPARLLVKLHDISPEMDLVGIDVSPAMVRTACDNIALAGISDRVQVREANVNDMPFGDGVFDIVVSTGSVHHWKDPVGGLNEIHRVLTPRGYALMYDVVSDTPRAVLAEAEREFGRLRTLLFWLHGFEEPFYSQAAYGALARATHFGEGRISYVGVLCCLSMRKGNH